MLIFWVSPNSSCFAQIRGANFFAGPLQTRAHQTHESVFLILKMLTKRFFQPQMLSGFSKLGQGTCMVVVHELIFVGAFGAVYACKLLGQDVAVKHINISKSISDRSVPHDIFTELLILDKVQLGKQFKVNNFPVEIRCKNLQANRLWC